METRTLQKKKRSLPTFNFLESWTNGNKILPPYWKDEKILLTS